MRPDSTDGKRNGLLLVDCQNPLRIPDFELFVARLPEQLRTFAVVPLPYEVEISAALQKRLRESIPTSACGAR